MIIQATWKDGSVTHSTYPNDKAQALKQFADGLTAAGAAELVGITCAETEEEISALSTPCID